MYGRPKMARPAIDRTSATKARRLRRLIVEPVTASPSTRMPGLDALRSASMVAVVAAHAAYAYVACRVPEIPWAVHDASRSIGLDLLVWSSISWAMPAFFALGGFAASALWSSRGPRGFASDRFRRLISPAVLAFPTVLLPSAIVWVCGWYVSGRTNLHQVSRLVFDDREVRENRIGPAHLWFLEYLILMSGVFFAVRLLSKRPAGRLPSWVFSWPGPFLLAIPTALILRLGHAINGLDPIMDLRNSFVPNPVRWLHHAWFFAVGTWIYAARADLTRLIRWWPLFLASAAYAFAIRATLLPADLDVGLEGPSAWASCGAAALFGWLSVFGLIGLFLHRFNDRPSPTFKYLSDSSYWIYLTHFPIVGLTQVGMYGLPWSAWTKFAVSLTLTLGFGLLSYQGLVRNWWIGRYLNGIRARDARLRVEHSPS
jgi:glucan biosynthesis protein C